MQFIEYLREIQTGKTWWGIKHTRERERERERDKWLGREREREINDWEGWETMEWVIQEVGMGYFDRWSKSASGFLFELTPEYF